MAEPVSIAITAAILPIVLAGIQSALQLALDAMPEIHDARNKHAVKKLNALFFKARIGQLTEKGKNVPGLRKLFTQYQGLICDTIDFQQAKHYYFKIQAVALLSENQILLEHLEQGLHLMEGSLVVKDLMDRKTDIQSSNIDISTSELQIIKALKMGDALVETCTKHNLPDRETTISTPAPLDGRTSRTTEKNPVKPKAWEKPAMWCAVAVLPPLLFVPKIRLRC